MNPATHTESRIPNLSEAKLRDHRVLCRVDFNVPLDGKIVADDTRIRAALPTIRDILAGSPRVLILLSHLGRPKGKRRPEFSLAPITPVLSALLDMDVRFVADCVGTDAEAAIAAAPSGAVLLLENTRFHAGETSNDADFAASLARLGDVFVNDAFGTGHRAHASNVGLAQLLPAFAGHLLTREVQYLDGALQNPVRPFVAILGGAKVSDKIAVLERLLDKADRVLIGGGMANTLLAAQGQELGASLVEETALPLARDLLNHAADRLVLPQDAALAPPAGDDTPNLHITIGEEVPPGWRIMDIGPATVAAFSAEIQHAQTIIWNGPLGVTERAEFAVGSQSIARALALQTERGATTIVGGGDSAAAIQAAGFADRITHLSTGGGASLALLAGERLPALTALAGAAQT